MLVVQIEKPENEPLARWFEEIRTWLDVNECQPVMFASAGRRLDRLIYRLSFDDKTKAQKFSAQFAKYTPVTRRPTKSEQQGL